ncbi:MAG: hypothetical protein KF802_09145 [Bdellovibrionaceae bacterium]|nr:hypothetical protein [Pseudobdellovibrionaceae bacterium]
MHIKFRSIFLISIMVLVDVAGASPICSEILFANRRDYAAEASQAGFAALIHRTTTGNLFSILKSGSLNRPLAERLDLRKTMGGKNYVYLQLVSHNMVDRIKSESPYDLHDANAVIVFPLSILNSDWSFINNKWLEGFNAREIDVRWEADSRFPTDKNITEHLKLDGINEVIFKRDLLLPYGNEMFFIKVDSRTRLRLIDRLKNAHIDPPAHRTWEQIFIDR